MSDFDYATYYDVYGPNGELANDRDDTYDPEFRDPNGYCRHGMYVGGCGADLMCGTCEMYTEAEERELIAWERKQREQAKRESTRRRLALRLRVAEAGYKLHDIVPLSYLRNI